MKYSISIMLLATFLLYSQSSHAQNIGGNYRCTESFYLPKSNIQGDSLKCKIDSKEKGKADSASSLAVRAMHACQNNEGFLHVGQKVMIRKKLEDGSYIVRPGKVNLKAPRYLYKPKYWGKKHSAIRSKIRNEIALANSSSWNDSSKYKSFRYLKISKDELDAFTKQLIPKIQTTQQLATIPFKYRAKTKEFEPGVNLNALFGMKYNFDEYGDTHISVMGGIGSSSVNLNEENVDTKALDSTYKALLPTLLDDETRRSAISITTSVVLTVKNISFGAYVGWDHLIPSNELKWKNNGQPWLGFGIGYSFFNNSEHKKY